MSVLIFSDLHAPYHDKKAVSALYDVAKEVRPSVIVLAGDGLDCFSYSRFPKVLLSTPSQELHEGNEIRHEIWNKLKMICPNAKCIELGGNHIARIEKLVIAKCPELYGLIDVKKILEIPGVEVFPDEKHELSIDTGHQQFLIIHGWMSRGAMGSHTHYFNRSVVHGHDHQAYINYHAMNGQTRFEMSVGFMANAGAMPLKYRSTKSCKWVTACGVVDEHGPRVVLL